MKPDYRRVFLNIRGLTTLLLIFFAQTGGTLRADALAWPVSVGIPTDMVGELSSKPVSVGVPTGMVGELSSKPVSVGVPTGMAGELSSKPVSVALPFIVPDNNYMSKPVSGIVQAEPDCDPVTIAKVQGAINMYLGLKPVDYCVDVDGSGTVSIAEVQKVINGYLGL